MEPPSSVRKTMAILGYINYHSLLVPSMWVHSYFLSSKLRKEFAKKFTWNPGNQKLFKFLMKVCQEAYMEGFVALVDVNLRKCLYAMVDWSFRTNCSSMILLVKYVDESGCHVKPAMCDSRVLPPSCASGSCLGELSSLAASLFAIRKIVALLPLIIYSDSLSLVCLLKRRFDSKLVL